MGGERRAGPAEKLQSSGKQLFREVLTYELTGAEVTRESLLGGFLWLKRYMQADDVGVVMFVGALAPIPVEPHNSWRLTARRACRSEKSSKSCNSLAAG